MKTIGLTGGVGMGKSTCDRMLRARGVPVIDTDLLAREIVQPGKPALAEIRKTFGEHLIAQTGELRRDRLARLIFEDPAARQALEGILHPRIRQLWHATVETWRTQSHALAVVVIPLLFETGAERELDQTICVACTARTQKARLLERGWSEAEIQQRIQAQWPIVRKMELSNYVIWTEGGLELHEQQLSLILRALGR